MYNVSYRQYVTGNQFQPWIAHSTDFSTKLLAQAAMRILNKDIWSMDAKLTEYEPPTHAH
jgi:hypothetical protein